MLTAAFVIASTLLASFAASAQGCPANSSPIGSGNGQTRCQCNSGYVMQGGPCVRGTAEELRTQPAGEFLRWKAGEWPVLVLRCNPAITGSLAKWYLDVTFGPHMIAAVDSDRAPPSDFGITIDEEPRVIVTAFYLRFARTVKTLELPGSLITGMRRARTLTFDPRPHASTEVRVAMGDFGSQFDQQLKRTPACRI